MKKASGIAIILGNKILLCHPTNAPWENSYSIPKGLIDDGETELEAAIRECKEEVGIDIPGMLDGQKVIEYKGKNNEKPHKTVTYFILRINSVSEIGLKTEVVPKEQLQIEEVDWAGFVEKEEATKKIFWRLADILKMI